MEEESRAQLLAPWGYVCHRKGEPSSHMPIASSLRELVVWADGIEMGSEPSTVSTLSPKPGLSPVSKMSWDKATKVLYTVP